LISPVQKTIFRIKKTVKIRENTRKCLKKEQNMFRMTHIGL